MPTNPHQIVRFIFCSYMNQATDKVSDVTIL